MGIDAQGKHSLPCKPVRTQWTFAAQHGMPSRGLCPPISPTAFTIFHKFGGSVYAYLENHLSAEHRHNPMIIHSIHYHRHEVWGYGKHEVSRV